MGAEISEGVRMRRENRGDGEKIRMGGRSDSGIGGEIENEGSKVCSRLAEVDVLL